MAFHFRRDFQIDLKIDVDIESPRGFFLRTIVRDALERGNV